MKLSKRHKVCIAVLGLAVCGLVIDRTLLQDSGVTGPRKAAAAGAGVERTVPPPPTADRSRQTTPPGSSADASVAERLAALAATHRLDPTQAKDAFQLRTAWDLKATAEGAPDPRDVRAKKFTETHTLEEVTVSGDRRIAAVNGQWVSIGQKLDDFKLIAVDLGSDVPTKTSGSATFEYKGKRVVLKLRRGR